ncbi:MAG: NAD(P)-binding protein, partial [Gemmatimonadales bacterium]
MHRRPRADHDLERSRPPRGRPPQPGPTLPSGPPHPARRHGHRGRPRWAGRGIRLRLQGFRVTILEQHHVPGGRCGVWESEGFRF